MSAHREYHLWEHKCQIINTTIYDKFMIMLINIKSINTTFYENIYDLYHKRHFNERSYRSINVRGINTTIYDKFMIN